MAEVKGFCGMRYTAKAGKIEELVCPPYDIISEEERKQFLQRNPHNVIRLELPKEGTDPYQDAGDTLESWLEQDILACDENPRLYIYEEEFIAHGQPNKIKGIIGRVRLEPFEKGIVLPHEETLSKAKEDRFNLMKATRSNFSSIYSLYFDEESGIFEKIDSLSQRPADQKFTLEDGITHRLWMVENPQDVAFLEQGFANKTLYIADGHHRYETGLNYKRWLQEQGVDLSGNQDPNYIMMTLVNIENPGLVVFPTHRVVRELTQFNLDELLQKSQNYFTIEEISKQEIQPSLDQKMMENKKAIVAYSGGKAVLLTLKDTAVMNEWLSNYSQAYRELDVSILHQLILEGLLGIDKENMANQKNLTYTRDSQEAIRLVDQGEGNCAFLINPTRVDEIAAVAGAGEKMPQKSTYFYPKIITGHVMNHMK